MINWLISMKNGNTLKEAILKKYGLSDSGENDVSLYCGSMGFEWIKSLHTNEILSHSCAM